MSERANRLRLGLRCLALGFLVGVGAASTTLPSELRVFLILWPLCMFGLDVLLERKGTIGEAMDRDEARRR